MVEQRARRPILRWLVPALFGLVLAAHWVAFFAAGFSGVFAWHMLTQLLPVAGVGLLLFTGLYALVKRRLSQPLLANALLGLLALWPFGWAFGITPIKYPASLSSTSPSATVRLPSDAPLRVLWGGDTLAVNVHASFPNQRWAYDLGVEPVLVASTRREDYGCFNSPVLAPAPARVQRVRAEEADVTPGTLTNAEHPCGNFVALELDTKTYLVICHLQQGSVAVHEGDNVTEGQLLARCGNSGHTSEPHIHIHHQREPFNPDYITVAEGLPLFFRGHGGPAMPEGGLEVVGGRVIARGPLVQHQGSAPSAP